jgi:hypothetical protein
MAMIKMNDPRAAKKMGQMFRKLGPGQVDEQVRQAIHFCWMILPDNRRTIDELEKQIRRIVDRAFKDLREDAKQFGLGK